MKKIIPILLLISVCNIFAKEEVKTFRTNEIIVISEDKQIEKSTSSSDFKINDLNRNKYFSLDNLINEISGFRSIRNSKNEAYFRLRGLDQRQIGIYFDGIPIVNQFDGMVDLSQFSLSSVDKISISKGLSSALYGANNLGGSINIITDNAFSDNYINANANYGSISQNFGIKAKQRLGEFYLSISADYSNFDNFRTSSDFIKIDKVISNSYSKSHSVFTKIANQIGNSFIHSLSFMYSGGEKGIPVNLETTRKRYWKMPEWNNFISNYATNFQIIDNVLLKTNLFATHFRNIIDSYDDSTYTSQKTKSAFHSTQEYIKLGGSAILEINWEKFEQTKFAISFHNDNQHQQSNLNEAWKDFSSQLLSLSAEQNFSIGNFGGLVGANYDKLIPTNANGASLRPSEDYLNYQAGLNYSTEYYNIFINYSHKSRFPTLKEFYSEVIGANKPNPNLKSEFSDNLELGFRSNVIENLAIHSSIFANYVKNLIDITVLEDKSRQFINIGKVFFAGVELDLKYNFYDYLINFVFNYLKSENQTDGAASKIMILRPEFTTNFTISRNFDFGLGTQIQLQSYYKQFAYNSDKKEYFELPNYNLLNITLSYQIFKNLDFNATMMNVLDELYYSDWGYPQAGFNFNFGIRLNY